MLLGKLSLDQICTSLNWLRFAKAIVMKESLRLLNKVETWWTTGIWPSIILLLLHVIINFYLSAFHATNLNHLSWQPFMEMINNCNGLCDITFLPYHLQNVLSQRYLLWSLGWQNKDWKLKCHLTFIKCYKKRRFLNKMVWWWICKCKDWPWKNIDAPWHINKEINFIKIAINFIKRAFYENEHCENSCVQLYVCYV